MWTEVPAVGTTTLLVLLLAAAAAATAAEVEIEAEIGVATSDMLLWALEMLPAPPATILVDEDGLLTIGPCCVDVAADVV